MKISTEKAWRIYNHSPNVLYKWEIPAGPEERLGSGLLLAGCPVCEEFQTRETYIDGFWVENIELRTSLTCTGISLCKCGAWVHWDS